MNATRRLYDLLPAQTRLADIAQGSPLGDLLAVVEDELERVELDIERLYDNWFIETCEEWVVPYLGDLLGVQGILPTPGTAFTQRGLVANSIAYRRAKGTAAVLEQLARDVTSWPALVIESFQRLTVAQHVNHVRLDAPVCPDLRDTDAAAVAGSPFERVQHTPEVRHADSGRGRYNVPVVSIHLFRTQAYAVQWSTARPVEGEPGRYTFDPLGHDTPLFNQPSTETAVTQLAGELNVPVPLRRRPLHDELTGARAPARLLTEQPVLAVRHRGASAPDALRICDLSDPARRLPAGAGVVGVDPELGRIALAADAPADPLEVSFSYGAPADLGAGPYDRRASLEAEAAAGVDWQRGVTTQQPVGEAHNRPELTGTLTDALAQWRLWAAGAAPRPDDERVAVIALMDSTSYAEALTIDVPAGHTLVIAAADWPTETGRSDGPRVAGRLFADERRPHLRGAVTVSGAAGLGTPGELVLDGLLLEGDVTVGAGDLGRLRIAHCTLAPAAGGARGAVVASELNRRLSIDVERCLTGPLEVAGADTLAVSDSIVDGRGAPAIAAADTTLEACTVLGALSARTLSASNSILDGVARAQRRQTGCVRFSWTAPGSVVARRFQCPPPGGPRPAYASRRFGDPDYGRLGPAWPPTIAEGAEHGGEMGALYFLHQPARLANLRARLDEHLRFGLEAGIFLS